MATTNLDPVGIELVVRGYKTYLDQIAKANEATNKLRQSIAQFNGGTGSSSADVALARLMTVINKLDSAATKLAATNAKLAQSQQQAAQAATQAAQAAEQEATAWTKLESSLRTGLTAALDRVSRTTQTIIDWFKKLAKSASDLARTILKSFQSLASTLGRYLSQALSTVANFVSSAARKLKQLGDSTLFNPAKQWQQAIGGIGAAVRGLGMIAGAAGLALGGMFIAGSGAAAQFEHDFMRVAKVIEGTDEQLASLALEMRGLAIGDSAVSALPGSVNALLDIAQMAGQLGISRENLPAFTEIIGELVIATPFDAETAATSLSQFLNANAINMMTSAGVEQADRLSSVLVALGNTMATQEDYILTIAQRVGPTGATFGVDPAEILAMSAVLSSLGVRPAAGGSSLARLFTKMSEGAEGRNWWVTQLAGMGTGEFARIFEDNPVDAMLAVLRGMQSKQQAGDDVMLWLENAGITSIRDRQALLGMANNIELVERALRTANDAYEENNARSREAARFADTLISHWNRLKNIIREIAIALGQAMLPVLKAVVATFEQLLFPLAQWISGFAQAHPRLLAAVGVLSSLAAIMTTLSLLKFNIGSFMGIGSMAGRINVGSVLMMSQINWGGVLMSMARGVPLLAAGLLALSPVFAAIAANAGGARDALGRFFSGLERLVGEGARAFGAFASLAGNFLGKIVETLMGGGSGRHVATFIDGVTAALGAMRMELIHVRGLFTFLDGALSGSFNEALAKLVARYSSEGGIVGLLLGEMNADQVMDVGRNFYWRVVALRRSLRDMTTAVMGGDWDVAGMLFGDALRDAGLLLAPLGIILERIRARIVAAAPGVRDAVLRMFGGAFTLGSKGAAWLFEKMGLDTTGLRRGLQRIQGRMESSLERFMSAVFGAFSGDSSLADVVAAGLRLVLDGALSILDFQWLPIWRTWWTEVVFTSDNVSGVGLFLSGLLSEVYDFFRASTPAFATIARNWAEGFMTVIGTIGTSLVGAVLGADTAEAFSAMWDRLTEGVMSVAGTVASTVTTMLTNVFGALSGNVDLKTAVKDMLTALLAGGIELIGTVLITVADLIGFDTTGWEAKKDEMAATVREAVDGIFTDLEKLKKGEATPAELVEKYVTDTLQLGLSLVEVVVIPVGDLLGFDTSTWGYHFDNIRAELKTQMARVFEVFTRTGQGESFVTALDDVFGIDLAPLVTQLERLATVLTQELVSTWNSIVSALLRLQEIDWTGLAVFAGLAALAFGGFSAALGFLATVLVFEGLKTALPDFVGVLMELTEVVGDLVTLNFSEVLGDLKRLIDDIGMTLESFLLGPMQFALNILYQITGDETYNRDYAGANRLMNDIEHIQQNLDDNDGSISLAPLMAFTPTESLWNVPGVKQDITQGLQGLLTTALANEQFEVALSIVPLFGQFGVGEGAAPFVKQFESEIIGAIMSNTIEIDTASLIRALAVVPGFAEDGELSALYDTVRQAAEIAGLGELFANAVAEAITEGASVLDAKDLELLLPINELGIEMVMESGDEQALREAALQSVADNLNAVFGDPAFQDDEAFTYDVRMDIADVIRGMRFQITAAGIEGAITEDDITVVLDELDFAAFHQIIQDKLAQEFQWYYEQAGIVDEAGNKLSGARPKAGTSATGMIPLETEMQFSLIPDIEGDLLRMQEAVAVYLPPVRAEVDQTRTSFMNWGITGTGAASKILGAIAPMQDRVKESFKGFELTLSEPFAKGVALAKTPLDMLRDMLAKIDATVRSINAGLLSIPINAANAGIPVSKPYAKGGFVNQATYALIGEAGPELVLPLSNMPRTMSLLGQLFGSGYGGMLGQVSPALAMASGPQAVMSAYSYSQSSRDSYTIMVQMPDGATTDDARRMGRAYGEGFSEGRAAAVRARMDARRSGRV